MCGKHNTRGNTHPYDTGWVYMPSNGQYMYGMGVIHNSYIIFITNLRSIIMNTLAFTIIQSQPPEHGIDFVIYGDSRATTVISVRQGIIRFVCISKHSNDFLVDWLSIFPKPEAAGYSTRTKGR